MSTIQHVSLFSFPVHLFSNYLFRKSGLGLLLLDLSHGVDDSSHESDKNGGNGRESGGGAEKDDSRQRQRQLVESSDHGVGGGRGDSHTPGRAVRNTDTHETRDDHGEDDEVSGLGGEVDSHVGSRPVFKQQRREQENGNGQQVVVEGGVKVAKVGQLDSLSHVQHKRRTGKAVGQHPEVANVESGHGVGSVSRHGNGSRDITPSSNDGGHDHEHEGAECHAGDASAKPQNLTVGDQDNRQVLENGVDGDRQKLQSLGRGVDHDHKQQSNGEPLLGLVRVERSELAQPKRLTNGNGSQTHNALHGQQGQIQVERRTRQDILVGDGHENRGRAVRQDRQNRRVGD